MESFPWADCFVTGLPTVDGQHRTLVDLINRFGTLVVQPGGAGDDDVESVYAQLTAYAHEHFVEEEALMERAGIDVRHREFHHAEHRRFLQDMGRIRAEGADLGDAESARRLLRFMIDWLAYHILGSDQAMARQMAAVAAGTRPDRAWETMTESRGAATDTLLRALDGLFRQVSERNRELSELNRSLEVRVAERTRELSEANHRLEEMALTDVLTGLANRRGALQRLQQQWLAGAHMARPLACIMLDADAFKPINDAHGHAAGDAVLQELAWQVRGAVRTDDTVCRLGGDEFIVICPETPLAGALQIAEKIRRAIAALRVPVGEQGFWPGSASLGVASRTAAMAGVADLLKAADRGMYQAKRQGGNVVGCDMDTPAPPPG